MPSPSPDAIADIILGRREVYGLNTDSLIRQASNRLTARALLECLQRLDDKSPDFAAGLSMMLREFVESPSVIIGFDTGGLPRGDNSTEPEANVVPSEHYLQLVFRNDEAAYYQFHLFPNMDAPYITGGARKRAGAIQHLCIELTRPERLQTFIEECRRNPHLLRVDPSSLEAFQKAPSNAV